MAIHKDDVIRLDIDDIPTKWYNIAADLPVPLPPPLHPGTMQPATAEDLSAIFPPSIVRQEMSTDRYIDIPEEVRDAYVALNRPAPLCRARRLEQYLKTPGKDLLQKRRSEPGADPTNRTAPYRRHTST